MAFGGEEDGFVDVVGKMGDDFCGDVPDDVPGRSSAAKLATRGCFPEKEDVQSGTVGLNVRVSLQ